MDEKSISFFIFMDGYLIQTKRRHYIIMVKSYVESATGVLKKVLLCPPSYLALKPINKIAADWMDKGEVIDLELASREHDELISIYQDKGIQVEILEATKDLTSMTFARDFGFNLKEGYVLGRFKEEIRRPETELYKAKLKELSIPLIATCQEGILEGGDFWQLDEKTLAIGKLHRSNAKGIENIRQQLSQYGYKIIEVESDPAYLHLDMMFNIVGYKTAVTYYEGLPQHFKNYLDENEYDLIKIDEEGIFKHFCNLQALGDKQVISLKQNLDVNRQLRERGFRVYELDSTEILKTGGGPHCLTFPLEREGAVALT